MEPMLRARGITKQYGGVHALEGVNFDIWPGEVHALMGENGAGKSTLARILCGAARPDRGHLEVGGKPVELSTPLDAQRLGIAMIFQELDLFPALSVAENIVISNLQFRSGALVSHAAMAEFARPFLRQVGLQLTGHELFDSLSIAQQQLTCIARALSMGARIILMDEPTSSLMQDAAHRLFAVIDDLKRRGVGIVYVSHKMDEIWRICEKMTVLRDGRLVGTRSRDETNIAELIGMMVGRQLDLSQSTTVERGSEELLRVEGLSTHKLREVSFTLHAGEVLGVAGLMGAGRSELGAALAGLRRIVAGAVSHRGHALPSSQLQRSLPRFVGLVPEDRKAAGLMMQMSIRENASFCVLPRLQRLGVVATSRERAAVEKVREDLRIKCRSVDQEVSLLSGGNQQKTLIGRWLLKDPEVLFLDDPARGVDIGAKQDLYRTIDELAAQGKGILLASSELPELLRCCHRILVLHEGELTAVLDARSTTQEAIMAAATAAGADGAGPRTANATAIPSGASGL